MTSNWQIGRQVKPTLTFIVQEWFEQARCAEPDVDPEIFFTEGGNSVEAHEARDLCAECPVIASCLDYSLRVGVKKREKMRQGFPKPDVFTHGTEAGAKRHWRRGEKPCAPCLEAARLASSLRRDRQRREQREAS